MVSFPIVLQVQSHPECVDVLKDKFYYYIEKIDMKIITCINMTVIQNTKHKLCSNLYEEKYINTKCLLHSASEKSYF